MRSPLYNYYYYYYYYYLVFRFECFSIPTEPSSMAVSMRCGIPQIIHFKWYTMCGPWVYSYSFTKYVVFPTGVKGSVFSGIRLLYGKLCLIFECRYTPSLIPTGIWKFLLRLTPFTAK